MIITVPAAKDKEPSVIFFAKACCWPYSANLQPSFVESARISTKLCQTVDLKQVGSLILQILPSHERYALNRSDQGVIYDGTPIEQLDLFLRGVAADLAQEKERSFICQLDRLRQ